MNKLTDQIQAEVNKVVLGKGDIVRKVLLAILAQGHVLLEDVPGVGKTTLAKAFSKTLGLDSKRVQFTSDTLPSDIIGFSVFDKADGKLKYQSGAIMTNLLLADEINRTSSKTQSALLEAMEEGQVTVDRVTHPLPRPFAVLAAAAGFMALLVRVLKNAFAQAVRMKTNWTIQFKGDTIMPIVVNLDVMMARRHKGAGELAEEIGITPANLSILKNNKAKAVRFSTLEALCKALDCQPGELLEYVEEEP